MESSASPTTFASEQNRFGDHFGRLTLGVFFRLLLSVREKATWSLSDPRTGLQVHGPAGSGHGATWGRRTHAEVSVASGLFKSHVNHAGCFRGGGDSCFLP